jgi:hypothetical protein
LDSKSSLGSFLREYRGFCNDFAASGQAWRDKFTQQYEDRGELIADIGA